MPRPVEWRDTGGPWDHAPWEGPIDRGFRRDSVVWCEQCECAFPMVKMLWHRGVWWCASYPGCRGGIPNVWEWSEVREVFRPGWPEVPEEGKVYPLRREETEENRSP